MAHQSVAIANKFLKLASDQGGLTQMQLQKLVYLAHGWNLAVNGEPLVSDRCEAWQYGPVFRKLYDHTKYFGREKIDRPITEADNKIVRFFARRDSASAKPYSAELREEESQVLQRVWNKYGKMDAFRLSGITHMPGTPWHDVYFKSGADAEIPDEIIREHYVELGTHAAA